MNPATLYLDSLGSAGSRRTMRGALDIIVSIAGPGQDLVTFPWASLRFQHTAAIRAILTKRFAPSRAALIWAALRGVLTAAWRLGLMGADDYLRAKDIPLSRAETPSAAGHALTGGELRALFAACAADTTPAGARDGGAAGARGAAMRSNGWAGRGLAAAMPCGASRRNGEAPRRDAMATHISALQRLRRNWMRPMTRIYLPSIGAGRPSKGGVAMSRGRPEDPALVAASWHYNWYPVTYPAPGSIGVPMMDIRWGGELVAPTGDQTWIMGWNEPDRPDQHNMTPADAAARWVDVELRYADRFLVSPSVGEISGPPWLRAWYQVFCDANGRPPRVDALGCHAYQGDAVRHIEIVQEVIDLAHDWSVPGIWCTEFAFDQLAYGTEDATLPELARFLEWADSEPMIQRIAYYPARVSDDKSDLWERQYAPLVASDGMLTATGRAYRAWNLGRLARTSPPDGSPSLPGS